MAREQKEPKEKKVKKVKIKKPSMLSAEKQSSGRVWEILKKEYTFENWLLAILSPILLLYGVYIVIGSFGTQSLSGLGNTGISVIDFFFNTDLKRILTGSFLILIGLLVIVYLFIPYIKPSLAEMKKVSWPTTKMLASNSARVFAFLIFLTLVFTIYGFIFEPLFRLIYQTQG
jgi:preprotein translocase SecE subunit